MDWEEEPPSWGKFMREGPAILRMLANQLRGAVLHDRVGDGQPVLVLPGFFASDLSTVLLRRTLAACGFSPFGWGLGRNFGARPDLLDKLWDRLEAIFLQSQRPVILLGWSLGGVYARQLATLHPEAIACVVTLGSPFSGNRRANNAWKLYELINTHSVDKPPIDLQPDAKPPVYTVAIWSKSDGIVAPGSARGKSREVDEQIELTVTHMGLGSDPSAIREIVALLGRLAIPRSV